MVIFTGFICGAVFGLGLAVSGMLNPAKVSAFLDLAGAWDPSLAFVMGGGLAVNLLAFRLLQKRSAPLLADQFHLPQAARIDRRLIIGSALFGLGWALGGLCPGPAIAGLAYGSTDAVVFFVCMMAGLQLSRTFRRF
ncbi:MAG: DUF6691 family protein [Parvibaculales bacterium]